MSVSKHSSERCKSESTALGVEVDGVVVQELTSQVIMRQFPIILGSYPF